MTARDTPYWRDGDWCFYEYKLCQIVVKDGKVREASCGMFRTSGQDLSDACRPLTLNNANVTQHAAYWSDKLHKEGHGGLNYPDIHRKMVELWAATCDAEGEKQKIAAGAITEFAQAILKAATESQVIGGVELLRRRG